MGHYRDVPTYELKTETLRRAGDVWNVIESAVIRLGVAYVAFSTANYVAFLCGVRHVLFGKHREEPCRRIRRMGNKNIHGVSAGFLDEIPRPSFLGHKAERINAFARILHVNHTLEHPFFIVKKSPCDFFQEKIDAVEYRNIF